MHTRGKMCGGERGSKGEREGERAGGEGWEEKSERHRDMAVRDRDRERISLICKRQGNCINGS